MSLIDKLLNRRPKSANTAKERLQVIISREGGRAPNSELLQLVKRSVIEAISKHIQLDPSAIDVDLECNKDLEVLSVSVTLPETV